jgi:tetratricopeptide (TPR) repeat protein
VWSIDLESAIGVMTLRSGDAVSGLAGLREAVSRLKSAWPRGHSNLAYAQVRLAFALLQAGKLPEAETNFREALDYLSSHLPKDHPQIAEAHCGLGRVLITRGRGEEGVALLTRALPGYEHWGLADPVELSLVKTAD